jgi:hypothetical protein
MTGCTARIHGTTHAYAKRGCRCPEAIAAIRAQARRKTAKRCHSLRRISLSRTGFDEIAVARAVRGDTSITLTMPELDEAIDQLEQYLLSAEQIAQRLGIVSRTVVRRRAARRQMAEENGAAALPGYRAPAALRQLNPTAPDRTAWVRQEAA